MCGVWVCLYSHLVLVVGLTAGEGTAALGAGAVLAEREARLAGAGALGISTRCGAHACRWIGQAGNITATAVVHVRHHRRRAVLGR